MKRPLPYQSSFRAGHSQVVLNPDCCLSSPVYARRPALILGYCRDQPSVNEALLSTGETLDYEIRKRDWI